METKEHFDNGMQQLIGTGVALVTPFTEYGSIDWAGLENVLNHVSAHADYLVVLGTTGESATLSKKEKAEVWRFVVEKNAGKLPLVLGLGGNNTAELLQDLKEVDVENTLAILSVSPYYNKPSQEGIYRHYEALSQNSPLPIILYNVPGRTGSNMEASTTLRLAELPNIIGIKEASGNLEQAMQIAAHAPEDFLLISGDDLLTVPMVSIGAKGVISVLANAIPAPFCEVVRHALDNNFAAATQQLLGMIDLNRLMYSEGNPTGVKVLLKMQSICEAHVRLPLAPASPQLQNAIERAYQTILATAS